MRYLVTGGAGFIGSAVVRHLIASGEDSVLAVDALTYAGNLENLSEPEGKSGFAFRKADIRDGAALGDIFAQFEPHKVLHLAAETHVDRSIDAPADFITTNIVGTSMLLEAALAYWRGLDAAAAREFRFVHVSTDEVFGSLGREGKFSESSPYRPRSPYSASKASSDHLVRAWHETYGLPAIVTHSSNNYGPYQHPEKLIPTVILNALAGKAIPVYGNGEHVRDWIHVEDHASALVRAANGGAGESFVFGGQTERRNIDVVRAVCRILDRLAPAGAPHERLITLVEDRPGHDLRYAIDASKAQARGFWAPRYAFESGLEATVAWYLENTAWHQRVLSGAYRGERLGLARAAAPQ